MNTEQLAAIEARADAATEGPWKIIGGNEYLTGIDVGIGPWDEGGIRLCDAEFIADARTNVPALLALVREQAAQIERVRELAKEATQKGRSLQQMEELKLVGNAYVGMAQRILAKLATEGTE